MNRFLNNREQKIFVICLAVVIMAVFYNGLIVPLQGEKDSLHQEIALEKKQLEKSLRVIEKMKDINAQYHGYRKHFGKTGTGEEVASSVLSEIENIASNLKLRIAELKPRRIEHNDFDDRFSVSLMIHSELIDIVRFLHTLQQSPYFFDVEEIEINKSSRRKQGTIITRLVLGKTFILTDSQKHAEDQREKNIPL